ncbi:DUF58 domain-containing protein [Candidatus Woesearchaeota archaeon]|nr:DUF58 domain-containing protein [Candidatus Woesearchaeota archaeon]
MIDTTFLQQLEKFNLIISKRVTSNYTGGRASVARGHGMIIKDYRIYVPGDDFRSIDWKVYGRTDKLHIRKYEEERSLNVHVIIDASASMNFGSPVTKFEYASMLGVGFAFIAMKHNEKFRYCTFADQLQTFKPKRGRHQLAMMIDHFNSVKPDGISQFEEAMARYQPSISSRSFIIIISDFLLDIAQLKHALPHLGDQTVKVIQVLDKKEVAMNIEGDFRLIDSETKSSIRTFISRRMRQGYQQRLKSHVIELEGLCDDLGYDFHLVSTDRDIFDVFYQILG